MKLNLREQKTKTTTLDLDHGDIAWINERQDKVMRILNMGVVFLEGQNRGAMTSVNAQTLVDDVEENPMPHGHKPNMYTDGERLAVVYDEFGWEFRPDNTSGYINPDHVRSSSRFRPVMGTITFTELGADCPPSNNADLTSEE